MSSLIPLPWLVSLSLRRTSHVPGRSSPYLADTSVRYGLLAHLDSDVPLNVPLG